MRILWLWAVLTILVTGPSDALQPVVTAIEANPDGSVTYRFSVRIDDPVSAEPAGQSGRDGDFFTIYGFYGLVDGSVVTPPGWQFSAEDTGKTPIADGYPLVLPMDLPGLPNLSWTATRAFPGGAVITGFAARTLVHGTTIGQYAALVTRPGAAIPGLPRAAAPYREARIGRIVTPAFLAELK